jgi:hypothetical protein
MIVLYERRCGVSKVKSVDASVCWAYVIYHARCTMSKSSFHIKR